MSDENDFPNWQSRESCFAEEDDGSENQNSGRKSEEELAKHIRFLRLQAGWGDKGIPHLRTLTDPNFLTAFDDITFQYEDILNSLQQLTEDTEDTDTDKISLEEMQKKNPESSYKNCWEVQSIPSEEVMKRIEGIYAVFEEQNNKYYFVEQKPESIIYVKELECYMMCGKRKVNCYETRANDANMRFFRLEAVLNLIYHLCKENKRVQKSYISYAYDDFFKTPQSVDPILNSICAMIGCTRHNLNIMSSSNGKFIGDVNFQYHGDEKIYGANNEAVSIKPQSIDRITFMHPANPNGKKVEFILLVEKETVFQMLVDQKFHENLPCIVVSTGRGEPDIATRIAVKKMKQNLKVHVLVLTDCNPHGLEIVFSFLYGSKALAHESRNLRTRDAKWMGLRPQDLGKLTVEHHLKFAQLKTFQRTRKKQLLAKDFVKENLKWQEQLEQMKCHAEIEVLSHLHLEYLSKVYLPNKLRDIDWND